MDMRTMAVGGTALGLCLAGMLAGPAQAAPGGGPKVTICHATSSAKNPYVVITVSVSAIGGGGKSDHSSHAGDIIPPVNGGSGQNWDAAGTAIYAAGCAVVRPADTDRDGIIDLEDPDDDGDGIPDASDADDDGDGTPDTSDPSHELTTDTDGDKVPDALDPDDDGDGISDTYDPDSPACRTTSITPSVSDPSGALDSDRDGQPDATDFDDDADGLPDFMDPDDDGDGIPDEAESSARALTLAPTRCLGGQRVPVVDDQPDLDGDGTPNASDPDDDGDGIPDATDPDADGDGIPNSEDADDDGDGITDIADPDDSPGDNPRQTDTDADGIGDLTDRDLDGDGIPNSRDADADGDGVPETRSAELPPGVSLVQIVRDGEVNPLFTGAARTSDGRPLEVKVQCFAMAPRVLKLGGGPDIELTKRSCKVRTRGSNVVLRVDADGQPLRVVVTVTAPATGDAKAYLDEQLLKVR